jgi:predicted HTH transcriptional regulator
MNLALLRNEYTIAIIPAVLRHEYIESLELVHKDDGIFKAFIVDRLIDTQMDLLRLLNIGGVNSLDLLILRIIQATPGLNAPALSIELNKSLRTMQRYLKKLVNAGKIEFIGAAKNGGCFFKMEK